MCGLLGWHFRGCDRETLSRYLQFGTKALHHRGPDDSGCWIDRDLALGLGHTRLSVIELSPLGHQPMESTSGRFVIVYNGEIYNFLELHEELIKRGCRFRGRSDTEVLVEAVDQWGVEEAAKRSNGMFAFAVWDRQEKRLSLCRDRLGIKPLYFGWLGSGKFFFGSELKVLPPEERSALTLNRDAVALFCRHNYVPAPFSIFEGIYKLAPGSVLTLGEQQFVQPPSDFSAFERQFLSSFWSLEEKWKLAQETKKIRGEEEWLNLLEQTLGDAVRCRMISDVPLGAFLSGGIDSSLVVSLMRQHSHRPVQTFSIGFGDERYNEAPFAKAVAEHLKTEHHELYVPAEVAREVIPRLPEMFDEPFADSSQIPTFLVSELARQRVTVSLSGDGGDELFWGYTRYQAAETLWNLVRKVPNGLKGLLSSLLQGVSRSSWERLLRLLQPALPPSFRGLKNYGDKAYRSALVLHSRNSGELYTVANTHWDPRELGYPTLVSHPLTDSRCWPKGLESIALFSFLDLVTYLPDDLLVKVDRASMATSLEARVPFLDYRVVELSLQMPSEMKIRDGQTKYALRKILERHLPRELFERPKKGFAVPLGSWLSGPLKEWAGDLLSPAALDTHGLFDSTVVSQLFQEHLTGKANWQYHLWDICMFQSWYRNFREAKGGSL